MQGYKQLKHACILLLHARTRRRQTSRVGDTASACTSHPATCRTIETKKHPILEYYSSTYGVLCTPPTWCWCTRKQEEKKRKEAKLQTSMHALCGVQATLTAAHAMRARAALSSCTGAKRHGHACLIDVHACECCVADSLFYI